MRWPSPRAQTAQPERWRMRRWSSEPRRMSVVEGRVEGRVAASLARASRVLPVRFIYTHETLKEGPVSRAFQTFLRDSVFSIRRPIASAPSHPDGTEDARLSVSSHVPSENQMVSPRRKERQETSLFVSWRSLRLGETRFFP